MIPSNANIFDLLLGPIGPAATQSEQPIGVPPGRSERFGNVLQLLMARQQGQSAGGVGSKESSPSWQSLLERTTIQDQNTAEMSPNAEMSDTGESILRAIHQALTGEQAAVIPNKKEVVSTETHATSRESAAKLLDPSLDIDGLLSRAPALEDVIEGAVAAKPDKAAAETDFTKLAIARTTPVQQSVRLEQVEGDYRILAVKPQGDSIELTVRHKDKPSQPIKLSLPIEMIDDFAIDVSRPTGAQTSARRVDLFEPVAQAQRMDELLARLNLKELHINKPSDTATQHKLAEGLSADTKARQQAAPSADKLTIELVAERLAEPVIARRELPRSAIVMRVNAPAPQQQSIIPQPETPLSANPIQHQPHNPAAAVNRQDATDGFDMLFERTASLQGRTGEATFNKNQTSPDTMSLPDFAAKPSETADAAATRRELPQVRFTLPDDIARGMKPGGRSVSIAIEPENLGPARLHLAMRDNALTARVTVETSHAKAMVEQSLDQLSQQLSRAGIKVDLIEVNVSGEQARQQFSDRSFAKRRRIRLQDSEHETLHASEAAGTTGSQHRPSLLGPSGVNL
ncbi:hypothetical protein GF420_16440, partial [candidate division GN15 bacterium]|nr:hypothetical protein [candidate division GN15 bacterium]